MDGDTLGMIPSRKWHVGAEQCLTNPKAAIASLPVGVLGHNGEVRAEGGSCLGSRPEVVFVETRDEDICIGHWAGNAPAEYVLLARKGTEVWTCTHRLWKVNK